MVDYVSMYALIPYSKYFINEDDVDVWDSIQLIEFGKLTLIENRCKKDFHVKDFRCEKDNLLFTLTQSQLIVSNSLHKYLKGNNYSGFSYSELLKSVKNIEVLTGIPAEEFHITKFELAINITTPQRPLEYVESIGDYKGREYDKMRVGGFWHGVKYMLTDYSVKIYDKTEEIRRREKIDIGMNILRFEIQYSRKRQSSLIKTLADFRDKEKLLTMFDAFLKTFEKINWIGDENFSGMSSRERELYFSGLNPRFWTLEKAMNRNTAKSKKKHFTEMQRKINAKDLIEMFMQALKDKIDKLLNS
jgi:hypothetical protein